MAERLTRSRFQVGGVPTAALDPGATLLRLLNEAKQDAVAAIQQSFCGPHKLLEACAKLREASTQLAKIVGEDLRQAEELPRGGGGLARSPTPRLPHSQAVRVLGCLLDVCHVAVRAVLQRCDPEPAAAPSQQSGRSPTEQGAASQQLDPAAPAGVPYTPAQLWRCAVDAASALQGAARLLSEPSLYVSYMASDPACEPLLALGELAAEVVSRATAATAAATAAAREEQQQQHQGQAASEAAALQPPPPDAACLLAAHACSLLLVACEQQPEGMLDALQPQPGSSRRLHRVAAAVLQLAAARIAATAYCAAAPADDGTGDLSTLTPQEPGSPEAASRPGPASLFSFHVRQLQLVSLRFSELLADDGGTKLAAKRALLPALAEALRAEPRAFAAWWGCGRDAILAGLSQPDLLTAPKLGSAPAPASAGIDRAAAPSLPAAPDCISSHEPKLQAAAVGMLLRSPASRSLCLSLLLACARQPAPAGAPGGPFGEGFSSDRFMAWGEGDERELLYVGGRGRGYKRRKVLNPEAHGVDSERVGAVLAAMTAALECAVLLCKLLANAAVGAPSHEQRKEAEDPWVGPPPTGSLGAAMNSQQGSVLAAVKTEEQPNGSDAELQQQPHMLPLASAFWQLLLRQAGDAAAGGSGAGGDGGDGSDPLAKATAGHMGQMARNLATLLSMLQLVCPNSGQEVRDAVRQTGFPALRWPRLTVRLPVLVVAEDCELLLGLLGDLGGSASEQRRRQEQEQDRQQRQQGRGDPRLKRMEAEQGQRDRDRPKMLKQEEAEFYDGVGGYDATSAGVALQGGDYRALPPSARLGPTAGLHAADPMGLVAPRDRRPSDGDASGPATGVGPLQPKVRLVLRRGAGAPGEQPAVGGPGGVGSRRKQTRSGDDTHDGGDDEDEDGWGAEGQADDHSDGGARAAGMDWQTQHEETAALLGLQVPRQKRSSRLVRPRTPTPPPDVSGHQAAPGGLSAGPRRQAGVADVAAGALPPDAGAGRLNYRASGGGPSGAQSYLPLGTAAGGIRSMDGNHANVDGFTSALQGSGGCVQASYGGYGPSCDARNAGGLPHATIEWKPVAAPMDGQSYSGAPSMFGQAGMPAPLAHQLPSGNAMLPVRSPVVAGSQGTVPQPTQLMQRPVEYLPGQALPAPASGPQTGHDIAVDNYFGAFGRPPYPFDDCGDPTEAQRKPLGLTPFPE